MGHQLVPFVRLHLSENTLSLYSHVTGRLLSGKRSPYSSRFRAVNEKQEGVFIPEPS